MLMSYLPTGNGSVFDLGNIDIPTRSQHYIPSTLVPQMRSINNAGNADAD
jgi:hypothetical protein